MFLGIMVVIAVLIIATLVAGIKIVPQGSEYVVQRLGKYHSTLKPGLSIVVPYIDQVAYGLLTEASRLTSSNRKRSRKTTP